MIRRESPDEFIRLITGAMQGHRIRKAGLARETGLSGSSIVRILGGTTGISKPNAESIVQAINKIAGSTVIDEEQAMKLAGYEAEKQSAVSFNIGTGAQVALDSSIPAAKREKIVETLKIAYEIAVRQKQ